MRTTSLTPIARWLRRLWQRAFGTFYEGPSAPPRLRQMVRIFEEQHPFATRADYLDFAAKHAEEAYRTGYVRGLEWSERDVERAPEPVDPEQVLEEERHGWSLFPTDVERAVEHLAEDPYPPGHAFDEDLGYARHMSDREHYERSRLGQGPRRR